jgi:electron transfer flavoprotein beta subunit
MNILICVKQVPEAEAQVQIDADGHWITQGAGTEYRMNHFDECAVEAAVQIKEKFSDTHIHILSIGLQRAEAVIRRSIGMGADDGTHMVTSREGFVDPFTIATWLASCPQAQSADLILCGAMSEDLMQGQVGPLMAATLGLPCTTSVIDIAINPQERSIQVDREIESGYRQTLILSLPAVLTIQTGINQPRYPALSKLLRANRLELEVLLADHMEQTPSLQKVDTLLPPRKIRDAVFLEGSSNDKAEQLITLLSNRSLLS